MRKLSRSSSSSQKSESTDDTSVSSGQSSKAGKVKPSNLDFSGATAAAPNSRRLASPGPGSAPATPTSGRGGGGRRGSKTAEPESDSSEGEEESEEAASSDEEPAAAKSKPAKADKKVEEPQQQDEQSQGGIIAAGTGALAAGAGAIGAAVWGSKKEQPADEPADDDTPAPTKSKSKRNGSAAPPEDSPPSTPSVSSGSEDEAPKKKSGSKKKGMGTAVATPDAAASKKRGSVSSKKSGSSQRSTGSKGSKPKKVLAAEGSGDESEFYSSPDDDRSMSPETSHDGTGSESEGDDDAPIKPTGKNRPKIVSSRPRRQKMGKPLNKLTYDDVKLSDKDLRTDITEIWDAMHLFMNSRMIEAEDICLSAADHRLYFSVGYTLIQCIKSLMTFEPEDLEAAIQCARDSLVITQHLRKKNNSMYENMGNLVKGTVSAGGIGKMTGVERHAELVFAECLLLKAVLGIIYSGDFVAFLKEALNMRSAYATYRSLAKYVEQADEKAGGHDDDIDEDFRSGVYLGNGLISLILSLLPSKVLKIMEVFGFTGDREYALRTLQRAGEWSNDPKKIEPGMPTKKEGIRRQICDMALLFHHLVISTYLPVTGVDIRMADKILHFNLDRYPEGVFFLYFAGRLYSTQTMGEKAVKQFGRAINAQREYIQLQHICHWDLALTHMAMADWEKAYQCFKILDKESNWSKAIYAYALGVTQYEMGVDPKKVANIMKTVPDLMQRIAGKSIPLEKFVARKSKKFLAQGNRLVCPGLELAYFLNSLGMAPRHALFEHHLDTVSTALAELHQVKNPKSWGSGEDYWDDYCLAHLMRGIILRFIAFPESHTKVDPPKSPIPVKEASEQAEMSFKNIFKHGKKVTQDHQSVWFAHYELGRLYDARGDDGRAAEQYSIVLDHPKEIEIIKKTKGKVSLQNMCLLRTNSANDSLKERGLKHC